ncbi:DUF6418 domain-containing protein [Sphingomonas sp. PL-96]|uniref:DUF6418 domain-containing protein n=1 Tax=Sphingomonas sp. PL-96 TaxID=2887201 RepID=UPI001E5A0D15|nr:DUF6418 domain-containing protein [Sphingomonas sp. PL-96]MCC2976605.1 DUF6418 domain-containing protein [Sphingomonas sp. PL-96]
MAITVRPSIRLLPPPASPGEHSSLHVGEIALLTAALAINWYAAHALPSTIFCWSSLVLFGWLLLLVGRMSAAGLILLLPLVITRGATLLSLMCIEFGAYMPEVNRVGEAGDASASFVAVSAIFFLVYAAVFRMFEGPFLAFVRSPLLDDLVALLAWPVLLVCMAWGAVAFVHGAQDGFPLLQGVDRFLYRRELGSPFVLMLLDQKFLIAAILGSITFAPRQTPMLKAFGTTTLIGLTCLYFLFGDKFFTILTEVTVFIMPLLLRRIGRLRPTILRLLPLAAAVLCGSTAATLYIYSGYGRLPIDRTIASVGERIAGQGELWFVASRDSRRATAWDERLVQRNLAILDDNNPAHSAFVSGVDTFYFIERYAPSRLADSFRRSGGWVQFTMGTEAMALVMFGYVGLAVTMALAGVLIALLSLYLRRAFASGFHISLYFAVWAYLQGYLFVQQAAFWSIAAPGQIKRLLLFATFELVLLALNRGQILSLQNRARAARLRPSPGRTS